MSRRLLVVIVFIIIDLLVFSGATNSQTVETFIPDIGTLCTSTGQLCYPPFSVSIETGSVLQVQYFVPDHCSSIRVYLFVDGTLKVTTGFLSWPGAPSPFDVLPLDTGLLDLGPVSPGTHLVSVQAEGQVSGCNGGQLFGWGGSLKVLTSPHVCQPVAIVSNFNGTPIRAGNFLWFNSVLKANGLGATPVTISLRQATVQFTANNTPFNVDVPDADITFDPNATTATTSFNTTTDTWETTVPSFGLSGNTFLTGDALPVTTTLPGGINPVTWSAQFFSNTPGVTLQWQWAAAVYTNFTTALNGLGVKPVDDNQASAYKNSDHAGTPENFKQSVIGGARGGGGSNFTGSYSGTKTVTPCQ
jgi:hypothetical protein